MEKPRYKVGDVLIWTDINVSEGSKTATITKIENEMYYYTFKNGKPWNHPIERIDTYNGIKKLSKLDKILK
jgi:hypothetical protein